MRKALIVFVVVAMCVGATALAAPRDQLSKPNLPGVAPGQIYDSSTIFPWVEPQPVSLPTPVGDGPTVDLSRESYGPSAFIPASVVQDLSSGFLSPRGSSIGDPRRQADREIRKLLRQLD